MTAQLFGWIPPESRTRTQHEAHERAMSMAAPQFHLEGTYHEAKGRYCLWEAVRKVLGSRITDPQILPYNHQTTGSCVGAGAGNMAKTLMAVEICAGELEEWKTLWWPFTYGRSRFRANMKTPGEGSFGSAWAEAAVKDGLLAHDDKPGLPTFGVDEGWLKLPQETEYGWSDGDAANVLACMDLAKLHLIGGFVKIANATEGKAAIVNGNPMTLASMFGTRGPRLQGDPPVQLAEWDDRWAHQMSCPACWDHPTLGLLFFILNNWGKKAHPRPGTDEPWGGFWVTARTFDRICGEEEVIAFRGLNGWRVRELDFFT